MAEVLITLGIIGVVAAMTIPTLITRYQKKMTAINLKSTYVTLQQAFNLSVAENGDMDGWGLETHNKKQIGAQGNDILKDFVETYFLPYIKPVKNYGVTSFQKIGYKTIYSINGAVDDNSFSSPTRYIIALANGSIVGITLGTGYTVDEEGNKHHFYRGVFMLVDLNGFSGANIDGKDIFFMYIPFVKSQFGFYDYTRSPDCDKDRADLLSKCNKNTTNIDSTYFCGRLIQCDGWEIKDDYPW